MNFTIEIKIDSFFLSHWASAQAQHKNYRKNIYIKELDFYARSAKFIRP